MTDWPAYEAGLRRHGNPTFWLDETALAGCQAPRRSTPGGRPYYSDLASELVLTPPLVFHLALCHGTRTRRSWRKLHVGVDTDTGRIVAAMPSTCDVDDASQVSSLFEQAGPLASFTADGAYGQGGVYGEVAKRSPEAAVIVPPRLSAVPSETARAASTQRDRHLQMIAQQGRRRWQKASGYHWRALVEADISRFKRVIGSGLRSRKDRRCETEIAFTVDVLSRMLELGRPAYIRLA